MGFLFIKYYSNSRIRLLCLQKLYSSLMSFDIRELGFFFPPPLTRRHYLESTFVLTHSSFLCLWSELAFAHVTLPRQIFIWCADFTVRVSSWDLSAEEFSLLLERKALEGLLWLEPLHKGQTAFACTECVSLPADSHYIKYKSVSLV